MGQKVHPEAMRVGYIHDWKSNWFSERNFSDFLIEDVRIRDHITNKLAHAGLSDITIRKDAAEVERLFKSTYQGCRYSFGYPACPNLEDQTKVF